MKTKTEKFALRLLVVAVQSVLISLVAGAPARAAEAGDDLSQLTRPSSSVEVGLGDVSKSSYKFGEYNGLEKSGGYLQGNVHLNGSDAWDSGGTKRWSVNGNNLGLDTRSLDASFSQQGSFSVNFGFDDTEKNRSDSYRTPYRGAGSDVLTLPSNWVKPVLPQNSNNVLVDPSVVGNWSTATNFRGLGAGAATGTYVLGGTKNPGMGYNPTTAGNTAMLTAIAAQQGADIPDFQSIDLSTTRKKSSFGFNTKLAADWTMNGSISREKKTGLQQLGMVSSQVSEFSTIIPLQIDQTTDLYNLGLSFQGEKALFTANFYDSMFRNHVPSMTVMDVSDMTKSATMSTMPDNQMQQLELLGRYNFTDKNRLVVDASYGKNTQNEGYLTPDTAQNKQLAWGLPQASLNGKVINEVLNAKFTSHPTNDFSWAANFKYDKKDNKTPVNTYLFQDANEAAGANSALWTGANLTTLMNALGYGALGATSLPSNINIYQNQPYGKTLTQLGVDGDYRIAKGQVLKLGVESQNLKRSCHDTWINCAEAASTRDKILKLEWKTNNLDNLTTNLAYAHDNRKVSDYNPDAFLAMVPAANFVAAGQSQSVYAFMKANGLTGFGPSGPYNGTAGSLATSTFLSGNNGVINNAYYASRNTMMQLAGMQVYDQASRDQNSLKARMDWQASDNFSLQPSANLSKDDYKDAVFGLNYGQKWSLNLDGTYQFSESLTMNAYWSHENQQLKSSGNSFGSQSNNQTNNGASAVGYTTIYSGNAGCYATVQAKNNNAKNDPCLLWTETQTDSADTFGIALKKNGLLDHHLDLSGDLSVSYATTDVAFTGGTYAANPYAGNYQSAANVNANPGLPAFFYIPAAATPTNKTNLLTLKLKASYAVTASSTVQGLYQFQHLKAEDYAYDGLQYGTVTNVLPTSETAPRYNISVVALSWIYTFQ